MKKKKLKSADVPFNCVEMGNMVEWEDDNGEKRQIAMFKGTNGDVVLIFKRGEKETPLRLSKKAVSGLLHLFLQMKEVC